MLTAYARRCFRAKGLILVGQALFILVFSAHYLGSSPFSDCPVTVIGPETSKEGQPIVFRANPTNYQSYAWVTSTGDVSGPRNTASITVVNVPGGSSCTATVTVRNGECQSSDSHTTTVSASTACFPINLSCPDSVKEGVPLKFSYAGPSLRVFKPTFNWTISAGIIKKGQGKRSITVDTKGLGGQTVTATLEIGGIPPQCARTGSCTTAIVTRSKDKN